MLNLPKACKLWFNRGRRNLVEVYARIAPHFTRAEPSSEGAGLPKGIVK